VSYLDLHIRNVPTNVREFGGARMNGNSIFVFEVADLCIAHLGHLHHTLTDVHLGELGQIDVLLVPADGSYTMAR
jgi:L-ascorbate metabolism protein UlaG (beta-lactamase superfamily)